jgi:hypothetical protein
VQTIAVQLPAGREHLHQRLEGELGRLTIAKAPKAEPWGSRQELREIEVAGPTAAVSGHQGRRRGREAGEPSVASTADSGAESASARMARASAYVEVVAARACWLSSESRREGARAVTMPPALRPPRLGWVPIGLRPTLRRPSP